MTLRVLEIDSRDVVRVNLTLDDVTAERLQRHARRSGERQATLARELLRQALDQRDAAERARKLAADYAAGRAEARRLLSDWEGPQAEAVGDEVE